MDIADYAIGSILLLFLLAFLSHKLFEVFLPFLRNKYEEWLEKNNLPNPHIKHKD